MMVSYCKCIASLEPQDEIDFIKCYFYFYFVDDEIEILEDSTY